ncbi:hypothetical protein [Pseudomonas luteola]|uniref:hypothetical protein n=2 Tax=Pseudomonas luteola TaxID=47886 RepID=UPI00142EABA7|nr:hypothetical protein [Pseudomonas luteola]
MCSSKTLLMGLSLTVVFAFMAGCKDHDYSKYVGTWKTVNARVPKTLVMKEEGDKLRATETIDNEAPGLGWDVDIYLTAQTDDVLVETSDGEIIPKLEMQKDGTLLSHLRSNDAIYKKVN